MPSGKNKINLVGKYTITKFPQNRQLLSDIYDEFLKKHYMTGFIEVNITRGKQLIKNYQEETGLRISFTAWMIKCIADSIKANPEMNSFRKGRNKIIQFEDIDIVVMIEKKLENNYIAIPYPIRKCHEKGIVEISNEIHQVQHTESFEKDQLTEQGVWLKLYPFIPRWIRQRFIRRMIRNPIYLKKQGGLVVVTSVSAFTGGGSGWVNNFGGMLTVSIALGGKSIKQKLINEKVIEEEFLQISVSIDHDIIDGAPAARFITQLVTLIEKGYLVDELLSN